MAINKLTSRFCDISEAGTHFDEDGLYLLVEKDGKKYWRMVCYLNGKRKLPAFGRYPKISLAKAREERIKDQELISQGIDPVQHAKAQKLKQETLKQKQAQEADNTFEQIARRLHQNKASKTSDKHRNRMIRQFEIHLFPLIGDKLINEIQSSELLTIFRNIAAKTNHGRPMTYMAKRLCQWTGEVYDLANIENNVRFR